MSRCAVNHLDLFIADGYTNASHDRKTEEKKKRMNDEAEFEKEFFKKHFNVETYEELMNKF